MADWWDFALGDLRCFRGLDLIEREFGVRFRLFGGAASRLAMALYHKRGEPDLPDLTPFCSDIDLAHTGDASLNQQILQAIDATLPEASWCRWSLIDRGRWTEMRQQQAVSAIIPLRAVEFRSWRATKPDQGALDDLKENRVTIQVNPAFTRSRWYRDNEDLELFSGLVAIASGRDLEEVNADEGPPPGPRLGDIVRGFNERRDRDRLRSSAKLSRRLRYLSAAIVARGGQAVQHFNEVMAAIDLKPQTLPDLGKAMVISSSLEDGDFRAPIEVDLPLSSSWHNDVGELRLDSVFEVSGYSQRFELRAGKAPSSGVSASGTPREFVHLAWRTSVDEIGRDLGAFVVIDGTKQVAQPFATGGVFRDQTAWLRVDLGELTRGAKNTAIRLAIVRSATAEESENLRVRLPIWARPGMMEAIDDTTAEEVEQEYEHLATVVEN